MAAAHVDIDEIDARPFQFDQCLAGPDFGVSHVHQFQAFGATESGDDDRFHDAMGPLNQSAA